jgi:hypothetical protein
MKDRIFFDVDDPAALLQQIAKHESWFIPTRMHESLNQHVDLVARLHGGREVEFDATVIGRRPPRAGSKLPAGIEVRASSNSAGVERLRVLLEEFQTGPLALADARFDTRAELYAAAERLLEGETVLIPVDHHVPRGAHARVQMRAPGEFLDVILEVIGTGHVDDQWQIRAVLYDADSCAALRRRLAAPTNVSRPPRPAT